MIDFADFEASKENILPVRQGRRPDVLRKLCLSPVKAKEEAELTKRHFEAQLKDAAVDQRLGIWEKYIALTRQQHPAGGKGAHLIPLYERVTKELNDGTLNNNDRYVRLWLDYASIVREPLDVYRFMEHNQIGFHDARLYIAWAMQLEFLHRYPEAEAVYSTGRQRNAQPASLLQSHYTDYAMGNVQRMKDQFAALDSGLSDPVFDENLTFRHPFEPRRPSSSRPLSNGQDWTPTSARHVRTLGESSLTHSTKRRALSIHQDGSPPVPSHDGWRTLPSEADRKRENVPPVQRWTETTVPCTSIPFVARAPKLDIFQDEETPTEPSPLEFPQLQCEDHLDMPSSSPADVNIP